LKLIYISGTGRSTTISVYAVKQRFNLLFLKRYFIYRVTVDVLINIIFIMNVQKNVKNYGEWDTYNLQTNIWNDKWG